MRRLFATLVVLGVVVGSASAKEGWRNLCGEPCPSFKVATWLNTAGESPQPKGLLGTVWLLEFLSAG